MPYFPKRRVVVPVDFSESSAESLVTARKLVASASDLHVIHILLPLDYMAPGVFLESHSEQTQKEATQKQCAEFVRNHGAEGAQIVAKHGDPGLGVTDYAASIQAELIVIASHGYHGLKRLLLGSVAERVIRHADCPVLVLRRRDSQPHAASNP
ncbi:MAG: universal stress protein [Planctomycetales bacterium]